MVLAPAARAFPIRAAFYYPWFPEAWDQRGIDPFTHFTPSAGFYGDGAAQLRRQVREMRYGGIDAAIASWAGRGSRTDRRVPSLLRAAAGTRLRWALYYEPEGRADPTRRAIRRDLRYIRRHYARDTRYLRVHGRFVVFVWADGHDRAGMARRWRAARRGSGAYVVLKVFPGYRDVAAQPDGWHQYAPAHAADRQRGESFSVSPGFFHAAEAAPRLERDPARFAAGVRAMVASGEPWQLVTTFNEWGEGTAVEPAAEWQSPSGYGAYLDALHSDGQATASSGGSAAP
jgi:hypothetical protein